MHTNYTLFDAYDDTEYTKIFFDTETGGFVVAHREHGKKELTGNKIIALMLSKHGYRVVLLAAQPNVISADATLDDEIWEFKTISETINMSNAVQKDISRAKRQAANILIFIAQAYLIKEITKGIYNAIKFDERRMVKKIGVLFQNGDLVMLTRKEILNETFIDKFSEG
jgi:Contact-dependent growth inhibition CdiA C-terminal domain